MPFALVISAPKAQTASDSPPFEQIFASCLGPTYAISSSDWQKLKPGCPVIILDKFSEKRAEAVLKELVPAGNTATGMQRYDVLFENAKRTPYRPEPLQRWGTAVIDLP